jgi:hypothetical protein
MKCCGRRADIHVRVTLHLDLRIAATVTTNALLVVAVPSGSPAIWILGPDSVVPVIDDH